MKRDKLENTYIGVPVIVTFKDDSRVYKGIIYKCGDDRYKHDFNIYAYRKGYYCLEYTEPKSLCGWSYERVMFRVSHIKSIKLIKEEEDNE